MSQNQLFNAIQKFQTKEDSKNWFFSTNFLEARFQCNPSVHSSFGAIKYDKFAFYNACGIS